MSSIRQPASSSTLSTRSTSSNTSSNPAHPASNPLPQYPPPAHHRSSTSESAQKDTTISTIPRSSPPPSPHHHHKDAHSNPHLSADEPLIHSVEAKSKAKYNKGNRGCMAQFDFTYSGLYVSGSKYGRKTLGTGTGAGGSGECLMM